MTEKQIEALRAELAAARERAERAERERDEATAGYFALTRRMNEEAAEAHSEREGAAKATLEWAALVEDLRERAERAEWQRAPAEVENFRRFLRAMGVGPGALGSTPEGRKRLRDWIDEAAEERERYLGLKPGERPRE